tara:strand:- start:5988 stop:6170 length:183 start_codon:yes stop_codon:yes gene_type:complete
MEQSKNTTEIIKFVQGIKYYDTLVMLHAHYGAIIDNTKIATMNDSVWFFVLKTEIEKRDS